MEREATSRVRFPPEGGDDYAGIPLSGEMKPLAEDLTDWDEPPETLGDLVDLQREGAFLGGAESRWRDELVVRETQHTVELSGERMHADCLVDAMMYSFRAEKPIDIRSRSPTGEVIDVTVAPGHLDAPEDMVISFELSDELYDLVDSVGDRDPDMLVRAAQAQGWITINAFPGREAFEEWTAENDRAAVAVTAPQAYALARDMAAAIEASGDDPGDGRS